MKKSSLLLRVVLLISVCFFIQPVSGQEKSVAEKEKEQKLQQAIELQKKALTEQKKTLEVKGQDLKDAEQDLARDIQRGTEGMNFYRSRVRSSGNSFEGFDEPMVISPGVSISGYYGRGGDSERTTWDFSKQVKATTFSRDYSFDVEASANTVVMTVMGDCKSGQIRVKILMPGGKVYSDIVIDEFGNLNWRKSFTISEEENKDKAGEWKFKIEAENATGFFKISLQTY